MTIPAKYRIFDHLIEGVQIIDKDFKYYYVNHTVAEHGKKSVEELLGFTMSEKYPGIEHTDIYALISKCMSEGGHHHLINEFDFEDGSKGYFELRVQPVEEGVLVMSIDVTEQMRAQEIIKKHNEDLEELVKIRTKELELINSELKQLSYIATHDLKTPVNNIEGFVRILKNDNQISSFQSLKAIDWIEKSVERSHQIISDLMTVVQTNDISSTEIETETIDLSDLWESTQNNLQSEITNSGAIINTNFSECPQIRFSKKYADSIMQNLVSNALKYRKPDVIPEISIKSEKKEGFDCLSIQDNGLGLDLEKHKDRVFGLFQRVHTEVQGTGMGLYIVKKALEKQGGKIDIDSELGVGTTFTVFFQQ
jgi:PAS domain S-box-containing protein